MSSSIRTVLATAPDTESGADLCRTLVEGGLVACGTIVPGARSVYRWEGRVLEEEEALLLLKTTESRIPALLRAVAELHPYEVPEVLVLGVESGHEPYLDWVVTETESPDGG